MAPEGAAKILQLSQVGISRSATPLMVQSVQLPRSVNNYTLLGDLFPCIFLSGYLDKKLHIKLLLYLQYIYTILIQESFLLS